MWIQPQWWICNLVPQHMVWVWSRHQFSIWYQQCPWFNPCQCLFILSYFSWNKTCSHIYTSPMSLLLQEVILIILAWLLLVVSSSCSSSKHQSQYCCCQAVHCKWPSWFFLPRACADVSETTLMMKWPTPRWMVCSMCLGNCSSGR